MDPDFVAGGMLLLIFGFIGLIVGLGITGTGEEQEALATHDFHDGRCRLCDYPESSVYVSKVKCEGVRKIV